MKNYLIALAALSLTGCAYSQYKADYIQQYAAHDCGTLESEMSTARSQIRILQLQGQAGINGPARRGVWVYYIDPLRPGDYRSPNERRMRIHARRDAISQLEASRGCHAKST